ncbi:MAG: glycosyltransferase family 2 protein [Acidimicrobiia bacterium]
MALITVVIPIYNEVGTLSELLRRLNLVREGLSDHELELVFVDNASDDGSGEEIARLAASDPSIRYVRFSRNFGPSVEASMTAGFRVARGDAVVVLYSDLQDPPELIPAMVEAWEQGADVAYGRQRRRQGESRTRRTAIRVFYRLMTRTSDSPMHTDSGDFRLVSRRVCMALLAMPERVRYTRGLISWLGFRQVPIEYDRQPRTAGRSKANFAAISRTALNAITSFSLRPLQLLTAAGFAIAAAASVGALAYFVLFIIGRTLPGVTTLALLLLFSIGVNMAAVGLIGEYVGRIYMEVKARPLYVIDEESSHYRVESDTGLGFSFDHLGDEPPGGFEELPD